MKALVLCGGRGTRLDADGEKPLYEVGGRPMVDRVLEALAAADVDGIYAATSPHTPRTREYLARGPRTRDAVARDAGDERDEAAGRPDGEVVETHGESYVEVVETPGEGYVEVVETPGDGYVEDLDAALDVVGRPAVTVAADLPLLAAEHVREAIAASDDGARSLTVRVQAALKRLLGATCEQSSDRLAPTGLNVVGPADAGGGTLRSHDARLAVNVNTLGDARIAEALL